MLPQPTKEKYYIIGDVSMLMLIFNGIFNVVLGIKGTAQKLLSAVLPNPPRRNAGVVMLMLES